MICQSPTASNPPQCDLTQRSQQPVLRSNNIVMMCCGVISVAQRPCIAVATLNGDAMLRCNIATSHHNTTSQHNVPRRSEAAHRNIATQWHNASRACDPSRAQGVGGTAQYIVLYIYVLALGWFKRFKWSSVQHRSLFVVWCIRYCKWINCGSPVGFHWGHTASGPSPQWTQCNRTPTATVQRCDGTTRDHHRNATLLCNASLDPCFVPFSYCTLSHRCNASLF